ncbi:MAG: ABC transporter ATP-binding protein [Spirochaetales bacterium]|nr:ABC transporter ATP-binding protein [Spirochaetales bacterium]
MLRVDSISKSYVVFSHHGQRILASATLGLYKPRLRFLALDGVSFTLKPGRLLGVAGPNGAGKSTLLSIIAGAQSADSGKVTFPGKPGQIRSILELGAGFSPELTVRENALLTGQFFGYRAREIQQSMAEILEFAELADREAMPLRALSTGQAMRLAFAVAFLRRSELLLLDEAFAVGDAAFQQKCIKRITDYKESGSMIILVSHQMELMRSLCDEMLLLDGGRILARGAVADVHAAYMELIWLKGRREGLSGHALALLDSGGKARQVFQTGEKAIARLELTGEQTLPGITVGLHIYDVRGVLVYGTNTHFLGQPMDLVGREKRLLHFELELHLMEGRYAIGYSVHTGRSHAEGAFVWQEKALEFQVMGTSGLGLANCRARLLTDESA